MSDYVIKVDNLGKAYTISHQQERYTALRDVMADTATRWGRRLLRPNEWLAGDATEKETFWALKDVSFEVKRGERLGIIGRNGAGKSTLLKVLSRITEPTRGEVRLRGRVASLLEVGTGFHPELTGRENIYLNGAILGMTKAEIVRKFDEIVSFAEVEKFLDTPVKRYSSGMYVRLAFAVAAHLEPEILLVDEVLAVGDVAFQKKCLNQMDQVASAGRTVLFVSHQMDMIQSLCNRCVLLDKGDVIADDIPELAISAYLRQGTLDQATVSFSVTRDDDLAVQIISGRILTNSKSLDSVIDVFAVITLEIEFVVQRDVPGTILILELKRNGVVLFSSFDTDVITEHLVERKPGWYKSTVTIPSPLLKPGNYSVNLGVGIANVGKSQYLEDIIQFEIDFLSRPSSLLSSAQRRPGIIATFLDWNTRDNS